MDGAMRVEMREVAIETQVYFTFKPYRYTEMAMKKVFIGTNQPAWSETQMNIVVKSWKLQ